MTQSTLLARDDYGLQLDAGRIAAMRTTGAWHDRILRFCR